MCALANRSSAFEEFLEAVKMVEILLDLERDTCANPPRVPERLKAEGLRGGAIVLLVASFEEFLESAFEEHLLRIHQKNIPHWNLPDPLSTRSVFGNLKVAIQGKGYEGVAWTVANVPSVIDVCKKIVAGNFIVETFTDTGMNPKSKCVDSMFGNVGVDKIFDRIQAAFKRRCRKIPTSNLIRGKLDEIVNLRNDVAHNGKALHISRKKLRGSVKFMKILAELLDSELYVRVKTLAP